MTQLQQGITAADDFRQAVLQGLTGQPRRLPCRFLYDEAGVALFARICELDEYYVTRTETALLDQIAPELASCVGEGTRILEFGGCTPEKARFLFDAIAPSAYLPVDICGPALQLSAQAVARNYPHIAVHPIHADFNDPLVLPQGHGALLGFFPGSTIGNMRRRDAITFLRRVRTQLGQGGALLIGVDLKKDVRILEAAYDDALGVTSAFIKNIIVRISRELESDLDPSQFDYRARYNARYGRMEMHLVCKHDIQAYIGSSFVSLLRGERIHIEDSHKYTLSEFQSMASRAGFRSMQAWTDPQELFSIHLLQV